MTGPTFNPDRTQMLTAGDVDHNSNPWNADVLAQTDAVQPGDVSSQRAAVAMAQALGALSDPLISLYRQNGAPFGPHQFRQSGQTRALGWKILG